MSISRRQFLSTSTAGLLGSLGIDVTRSAVRADEATVSEGRVATTVCPFCAVGCGMLAETSNGKLLRIEGDSSHPINEGSLCSKGTALAGVPHNPQRVAKVLYRGPGATEWQEKDWPWTLKQIAQRIKQSRDKSFVATDSKGRTVNRTEGIACLGGAALENETCYAYGKWARALGITYLEHQARVCHSSTVASLGASFGRGAMTNHWIDIANADAILVIGSNVAENHPVAFRWIAKARERGAKLISVDPRFTRTSAVADLYVPLRAGTDIALIGGLIHYLLENGLEHREYLLTHTNAALLVDANYRFDAGRFGPIENGRYDTSDWAYQRDTDGIVRQDPTLEDPQCVFQILRRHFARYTLDRVSQSTGAPAEVLRELADTFAATGKSDRAGTILYAMGTTQHSHGTQNIRAYALLQLLLGNIGVAGGGINALRGESNVQGSTDHGLLYDLLPGYLKAPTAADVSLAAYLDRCTPRVALTGSANWWQNYPKYFISLLKAYWSDHATAENEFAYHYLPKYEQDCSYLAMFEAIDRGSIQGLFVLGQNPAVSSPDVSWAREAMGQLEWLVVADLWETETAGFWKRPGVDPASIQTEVFLLPAASSLEKAGSVTNSGRWAQWRDAVLAPPKMARDDLWILDRLLRELRQQYRERGGAWADPILQLNWDYGDADRVDSASVAQEINGRFTATIELPQAEKAFRPGDPVPLFTWLRDDGKTAAGNWLYSGSYPAEGNQMRRRHQARDGDDPLGLASGWAWSWPANRRILYNRAGCNATGEPWDPSRPVVRYNWVQRRWLGDVPDGGWPPPVQPDGTPEPDGKFAFIMLPEGKARLFAAPLRDGPLPEHYEPLESPVENAFSPQRSNPLLQPWREHEVGNRRDYPIVATTCRLSEHWQSGSMSRNLPWLIELVPDAFVEISPRLAAAKGIANGDRVTVRSARGEIVLYAVVTPRMTTLQLGKRQVEQIALVWHFGYQGLATGPSANVLTPYVGDPNAMIPEYKAFLCDVQKAPPEKKPLLRL